MIHTTTVSLPPAEVLTRAQEFFADRSPARILELNNWLKQYCSKNGIVYLDYFTALVDDKGMLKRDSAEDGLHPNAKGYTVMAPLAEKAIQEAMSSSGKP